MTEKTVQQATEERICPRCESTATAFFNREKWLVRDESGVEILTYICCECGLVFRTTDYHAYREQLRTALYFTEKKYAKKEG